MTRRLFNKLTNGNMDAVPSLHDFEREYQALKIGEETKVVRLLIQALASAQDDIETHSLLSVLR